MPTNKSIEPMVDIVYAYDEAIRNWRAGGKNRAELFTALLNSYGVTQLEYLAYSEEAKRFILNRASRLINEIMK